MSALVPLPSRGPRCSRHQLPSEDKSAALIAHAHSLLRRHTVDFAFNGEQGIDALDRLVRDGRLVDARQIEELAPRCAQLASG